MRTRILDLPVQTATHAHPEHQLVIGLRGCADFEVQGQGGAVNRLHACVVPSGEAHAFSGRGHNNMLIMDLPVAMKTPGSDISRDQKFLMLMRLSETQTVHSRVFDLTEIIRSTTSSFERS